MDAESKRFWDHIDCFANSEGFAFLVFFVACAAVLAAVIWAGAWFTLRAERGGRDGR